MIELIGNFLGAVGSFFGAIATGKLGEYNKDRKKGSKQ